MPTISPENPLVLQTPSFLFLGPPGSAKTTLALMFPAPHILDCDENLAGPNRFLREGIPSQKIPPLRPDLRFSYDPIRYNDKGQKLALSDMWERYMKKFEEAVENPAVKTIVTDSLTGLDEFNLQKTASEVGGILKLEQQHWIPFRSRMKSLTIKMRQTGKINIVTCHQEIKRDQKGNITKYDVTMSSKLSEHFGWVFSDVYHFVPRPPLPENVNGVIVTRQRAPMLTVAPTGLVDAKNSFGMPPEIEGTWAELNKYLKLS